MSNPPVLALVMIVRNESETLARCLDSVRPHVDRLVVLDTGSTDDTVAIARALGAEVHETTWTHHFAHARNRALELAGADWHLVLDADEWLLEGGEQLRAWIAAQTEPVIGRLPVVSLLEQDGHQETVTSALSRLLPGDVRYHGSLHEQVLSTLPRSIVPVLVGHDGYEAESLARRERSQAYQASLDGDGLEPSPADMLYRLGRDCEACNEPDHAFMYYADALEQLSEDDACTHDLVLRALSLLKARGEHEQAMTLAGELMGRFQDSPDFFFALGDLVLDHAAQLSASDPERALNELMPVVEAAWKQCLEIGENPFLDGAVPGRGTHLAAHNLAVLYENMERPEDAGRYREMAQAMAAR